MRGIGRIVRAVLVVALGGFAGYTGYVGLEGSRVLVEGDGAPHPCPTPATYGWAYEAVNYDIALDAQLAGANPDPTGACRDRGRATAGDAIVTSDGIPIAGWYVPAANGAGPEEATIVLVHGWGGVDKSDTLRYAATLHDEFNVAMLDLRATGRSGGTRESLGTLESRDLAAFIDWLEGAKRPRVIGVLGDSGGAAAASRLARTDERIVALVLESPFATFGAAAAQKLRLAGHPGLPTSVLAIAVGTALRTGVWPDDGALAYLPHAGTRPLAISYSRADAIDIPAEAAELIYREAVELGLDVELHPVADAEHGRVVDADPAAYEAWVVPFFTRAFAAHAGTGRATASP